MKKSLFILLALMVFVLVASAQNSKKKKNQPVFKWYTFEEAYRLNKKNPKKIFIDMYTDWCGWCVRMDSSTFKDSTVKAYLAQHFYPVKFNAERKDSISFDGKTYINPSPTKAKSAHQLAIKFMQGQMSYPTFIFLNDKFENIKIIKGYKPSADLLLILKYIAEDAYLTVPFDQFVPKENSGN